uniref:Uncharacterized protein LOC8266776 n=1 Tax=Rhizophora mucronata TaxID=61149 RepID=A0A2P2LLI7_RHIMU
MGFKSVYRSLVDVFPQVDSRLLRAVAIEHSKDPHIAVEVVLSEVLPYLSKHSIVSEDHGSPSSVCGEAEDGGRINALMHHQTEKSIPVCEADMLSHQQVSLEKSVSAGETSTAKEDTNRTDPANEAPHSCSSCQSEEQNPPTVLFRDANIDANLIQQNEESDELILSSKPQCQEENVKSSLSEIPKVVLSVSVHEDDAAPSQIFANTETDGPASLGEAQDTNSEGRFVQISQVISESLIQENGVYTGCLTDDGVYMSFDGHMDDGYGRKSPRAESCLDATTLESENCVNKQNPAAEVGGLYVEVCNHSPSQDENPKSNEDIKIKQLEEIVEAAKNNKKTLFSAMESVMNMMSQVELREKAAEQAKEEAARGGLDILVKVDELKLMLAHAKEANDMHAGEVYGEKAILATEMKELQGRLHILSDERDKALKILDEVSLSIKLLISSSKLVLYVNAIFPSCIYLLRYYWTIFFSVVST